MNPNMNCLIAFLLSFQERGQDSRARGNESEPVADDQVDEQMIGAAFERSHESRFTAVGVPGLSAVDRRAIRYPKIPKKYEPNP
jgi:hypothetical protein